jgi:hypothetical protein
VSPGTSSTCATKGYGADILVCVDPGAPAVGRCTRQRLQHDIAGTLGNGSWAYIVGTYDKDAGPGNQRLYLNGARVSQMSGTLPIDLNSAAARPCSIAGVRESRLEQLPVWQEQQ